MDEGILEMIHRLPENLAVQALQKFYVMDKSTMRNRTAYLARILGNELKKNTTH